MLDRPWIGRGAVVTEGVERQIVVLDDVARPAPRVQHHEAAPLSEIRLVAQLKIVRPRRLCGWRKQRVGLLRPAPHAVRHPLVIGVYLLFSRVDPLRVPAKLVRLLRIGS